MTNELITYLGYMGALLILSAYFMVSTGRWKARSFVFQGTNVFASILLVTYAFNIGAYPNLVMNGVFMSIGLATIIQLLRK